MNNTDKPTFGFRLEAVHSQEEKQKREGVLNGLAGCLTNLQTIMNSDAWDRR
jgi:hypothetical protein